MVDDRRNPENDRNPETPDGYFNTPEGRGVGSFLDGDGKEMTYDELQEYWKQKEKRLEEGDIRIIGSGTKEDPYRAPGTPP